MALSQKSQQYRNFIKALSKLFRTGTPGIAASLLKRPDAKYAV
jgi:hypothetical protein